MVVAEKHLILKIKLKAMTHTEMDYAVLSLQERMIRMLPKQHFGAAGLARNIEILEREVVVVQVK